MQRLHVRELPPAERHPKIHETFAESDSGEVLELANDHEPKPLCYEMQAEVEREGDETFVAKFPKQ